MSRAAALALFVLATVAMGMAQAAANGNGANQPAQQQVSPDSTQTSPNANPGRSVGEVAAGTEIHATLDTPFSTWTSKVGDRFTATIADEVRGPDNGALVIPGGARVEGEVAEAEEGKTVAAALKGKGKLSLRFRDVVLPNGQTLPLTATLISVHDTAAHNGMKTTKKADSDSTQSRPDTAPAIGAGASAGLVFGGPVKGLAIGALAGGGYVLSIAGKDVNLPAQTGMVIRLDQSVSWNGTTASIQR